jgi:hypothetical protein
MGQSVNQFAVLFRTVFFAYMVPLLKVFNVHIFRGLQPVWEGDELGCF